MSVNIPVTIRLSIVGSIYFSPKLLERFNEGNDLVTRKWSCRRNFE